MGYRSDVVALIYPEPGDDKSEKFEQLKVLMATTFKDISDEYFGGCMEWMDADRVLKFHLDDVKWYPSSPDVKMFEVMLNTFKGYLADDDSNIKGYCTEFVRIGEAADDTEEDHTGDNNQYYLNVRRSIDCNL
jgi:hypothetical protein